MNKTPWLKYIEGVNDFLTLPSYRGLIEKIKARASDILEQYEVEFTTSDPYKTSKEMRADLINKKIKVYTGEDTPHPAFSTEENTLFRLVHDVDWHGLDLGFSLEDEVRTYHKMVDKLSLEVDEARALYSEIVGQVTAYYITREYQEQKILFIN